MFTLRNYQDNTSSVIVHVKSAFMEDLAAGIEELDHLIEFDICRHGSENEKSICVSDGRTGYLMSTKEHKI